MFNLFLIGLSLLLANPVDNVIKSSVKLFVTYEDALGTCSGNYISSNHILTNKHCVQDSQLIVVKDFNKSLTRVDIIYISPEHDLALLYSYQPTRHWIKMADEDAKVGDTVYVYGYPFGLNGFLAKGIMSQVGHDFLLNLTVLPGNSGSIVFNEDGKAIGIASFLISADRNKLIPSGISGMVPLNKIKKFLQKVSVGDFA